MDRRLKMLTGVFVCAALMCFCSAGAIAFGAVGYRTTAIILTGVGFLLLILLAVRHLEKWNSDLSRHIRKGIRIVLGICLMVFVALEIPIILSAQTDKDSHADYVIVLGAGVNGTKPSRSLLERLAAAFDYLEENRGSKVIVSGGRGEGEDITEAEAMRIWLERQGVDPGRIIKEERSRSTIENIAYSMNIIYELGGDPFGEIAIISSEYHLFRAKQIAQGLGAKPLGVAAKTGNLALRANYFIREAAAVVHMWIFGIGSAVSDTMA